MAKKLETTINAKDKTAEILLYGAIGKSFWDESGVSAKEFTEALNEIPKGTKITIGINSQGGSIGEGLAIHNAIARRSDEITARIDGYALSAGSFIPLAAGKVVSPESAVWMIHKGWSMAQGNADEFRKQADLLDKHDDALVAIYADRTGKEPGAILQALADETWLTGAEAVEWGLADETGGDTKTEAMDDIDLSKAPQGAFRTTPALALLSLSKRLAGGEPHETILPDAEVAQAQTKTTEGIPEMETEKTAPEANEPQAPQTLPVDMSAVVDAIKELKAELAKKPAEPVKTAEPVSPRVENLGNPTIEAYNAKKGADRKIHASSNYDALREARRSVGVVGANTVDADLVVDSLAGGSIAYLTAKLAPLGAFSTRFVPGAVKRGDVQVTLVTTAATGQQNPTNFESGDTVTSNAAVAVNHESLSFHVSNNDLESGLQLQKLAEKNARAYGLQLSKLWTAKVLVATYGASTAIDAAASFTNADLPEILALAKDYGKKSLILDGGHYAYLMPTDKDSFSFGNEFRGYGFDGIYEQNDWTNATVTAGTIAGFVCDTGALAVAAGQCQELPSAEFISQTSMTLPQIGLPVQQNMWFSRGSRALWCSFDTMFGVAAGDPNAAEVLHYV